MQRPETTSDVARAFGIGRSRPGAFGGGAEVGAGTGPDKTRQDDDDEGPDPEEDLLGDEETIALEEAVEAGWRVLVV